MFLAIEIKQGQPDLFLLSNIPRKLQRYLIIFIAYLLIVEDM